MTARNRRRKPSKTQAVTTGTVIRMEEPNSDRKPRPSKATVIVQEVNPVEGVIGFLRDHAIVGLSIGFIVGNQMSAFVKVLVEKLIDPMTKLLFGTKLSDRVFTLHFNGREAVFGWGSVVYNLLIILLLLLFIYIAIKVFN